MTAASVTKSERASGRPLDPEISARILEAALDVLDEAGYERLTMEAVAQRAGVHRPAVYRRWPTKLDLVVAALERVGAPVADLDTGDIRADLVALVTDIATSMQRNPRVRVAMRVLVGSNADDEVATVLNHRILTPRRAVARRVVERAIERGQLRADLDADLTIDTLVGTVMSRVLVRGRPMTRANIAQVVDTVLDGAAR